jgi:hypothetical protein
MVAFQSGKQRKVGQVGDDSHVLFIFLLQNSLVKKEV